MKKAYGLLFAGLVLCAVAFADGPTVQSLCRYGGICKVSKLLFSDGTSQSTASAAPTSAVLPVLDSGGLTRISDAPGSTLYVDNLIAASVNASHDFNTRVTRTAGDLLKVSNNGTSKFHLDYQGSGTFTGNLSATGVVTATGNLWTNEILDTSGVERMFWTAGASGSQYYSGLGGSSTGIDHLFRTNGTTRSGGWLGVFSNVGFAKFLVDYNGSIREAVFASDGALKLCSSGEEGLLSTVGGSGGALTKYCICTWDGTNAKWLNLLNPSVRTGTTSSCPAS